MDGGGGSGGGRLWPRADLRVGDTDRETVVAELQRHFVDGRLTSDELGERVAQALSSRTFGDLAVLLADLPVLSDPQPSPTDLELSEHQTQTGLIAPELLGMLLIGLGIAFMLMMVVFRDLHFGMAPFWPLMIFGFFIFGRPRRGGRRHF
ncbi:MAG TPA: DUF1707 domain-containing protein [Chloroflexota bacterium]